MTEDRPRTLAAAGSALAVVLVVALALAAGELLPRAAGLEPRHLSGLVVLRPQDRTALTSLPGPLHKALSDAWELARDNPDLFGYPYADRLSGELVLSPVNATAEALALQWTPQGAEASAVPRRIRLVDRTYGRLEAIKHEAIGPGVADLPDGKDIFMSTPDDEHNRVIVVMERLSDDLLFALAARYGTEAIAVRVEPNPHFR